MNTNEKRNWKSKFLGKLDESSPIFGNNNGEVQFKMKIVSNSPSDFPLDVKTVNGFSSGLTRYGYMDQFTDTKIEKEDKLKEFLHGSYLIFSVRESEHSNPTIEKKYYNSYDLKRIEADESNDDHTFYPIPLFLGKEEDINEIIEKIANEEYVGKNEAISLHKDDYPPFVIIGEKEESVDIDEIENFHIIGPIIELQYKEEYGMKFFGDEYVRSIKVTNNDLQEYYSVDEGAIFLPREIVDVIETKLSKAPPVKKSTHLNSEDSNSTKIEIKDELEFLTLFESVCNSKGLIYTQKDLYNFHTAMKTQSFVILAGMSGTGKSQLVQCYYEALNNKKDKSHSVAERMLFIPVRPFWQDDSDLLGYLDTLNGIYRPGDSGLVDFILESTKNEKECYIVCLDEMNLARVEHYFSQFLSILERAPNKRVIQLYNSKMDGRVYNRNEYPPELKLRENLFFLGTVNIDESTYQFSDKVLDRANVINLSLEKFTTIKDQLETYEKKKKENKSKEQEELEEGKRDDEELLTYNKFQGMKKEDKKYKLNERELELLWELHLCINKVNENMGIGMRIVNQIEQYLMNLPKSEVLSRREAFDLQISQRVFTKLRGSEGQLFNLVGKIKNEELIDSDIKNIFMDYPDVSDFEQSVNKLKLISKELIEYGHTL